MITSEIISSSTCIASFRAYLSACATKNGVTDRTRTKLYIELSLVHNRDNIDFYLYCKFQSLPFSVCRKNGVTDRKMHAYRISVQQSALVMQSEANHAVLTTIPLGVSTMFITAHAYHERDSFHSLLTRFLWTCAAIL